MNRLFKKPETHFFIMMKRATKLAASTATNIYGIKGYNSNRKKIWLKNFLHVLFKKLNNKKAMNKLEQFNKIITTKLQNCFKKS